MYTPLPDQVETRLFRSTWITLIIIILIPIISLRPAVFKQSS